jgi:hypothetical protein
VTLVNSVGYAIPEKLPLNAILAPLLAAEDAIARLDERARNSPLRKGWIERLLYREACASRLAAGELVHLEDLVLLDGGALTSTMTPDLSSAWHVLGVWRRASKADPLQLLQSQRPGELITGIILPIDAPDYFYDPNWNEDARLTEWRRVLEETKRLPPLLAATIAWDSWLMLEPDQRGAWRAPLIAALVLRARAKTRQFLLPLDTGRRFAKYRRHPNHDLATRLAGFLEWARTAAEQSIKDLDTLTLAAEMLRSKLKGRRRNSRLPVLVDLLLSRPLVSVPMAAKALRCSNQAVEAMLLLLGSIPREMTGRGRYRAWGIA